jgi:hypothetical protein
MRVKRYAIIFGDRDRVAQYLPANYAVVDHDLDDSCIIEGRDDAGWTLDGYVLPRLASGLIFGEEIDLSHEVMKTVS